MGFQIIPVDAHKNDDILEYICKHLWNEWEDKYRSLWGFTTFKDLILFYKNTPNITLYSALDDDGTFVGCFSLMYVNHENWLNDLVIPVKHRGKGIGRTLVEYAMRNKYNLHLNADEDVTLFYRKLGFKVKSYNTMVGQDGNEFDYYTMVYEVKNYDKYIYLLIIIVLVSISIIGCILLWF